MAKVTSSETVRRQGTPKMGLEKDQPLEPSRVETRARAAYRLRLAGKSNDEIAEHLECTTTEINQALALVYKYDAASMSTDERTSVLRMEVDRLDALMAAHWESAMYGEVANSKIVLECIKERAKIQHLYDLDPEINKTTVLVVGDGQRSYIEALKEAAGD